MNTNEHHKVLKEAVQLTETYDILYLFQPRNDVNKTAQYCTPLHILSAAQNVHLYLF